MLSFIPALLQKYLGQSYRTSLGALGLWATAFAMLISILQGSAPADEVHIGIVTGSFAAGWTAWHAKDKNVTGIGSNATTDTSKDGTKTTPTITIQ